MKDRTEKALAWTIIITISILIWITAGLGIWLCLHW